MTFNKTIWARRSVMAAFIAACAILSIYTISVFCLNMQFGENWSAHMRPVIYRTLIPIPQAALRAIIPTSLDPLLAPYLIAFCNITEVRGIFGIRFDPNQLQSLSPENIVSSFINLFVIYLSLLAFIAMFYRLVRTIYPDTRAHAYVATLLALLISPVFELPYAYNYDYAELFFSCAFLYTLFTGKWRLYLLCIFFGTINKETTIFGIFLFSIWYFNRLPRRQFIHLAVTQSVIYLAVKITINFYFRNSEVVNLPFTTLPFNIFYVYNYSYTNLTCLLVNVVLLTYQWQQKPAFLRAGLWMFTLNFIAYFICCNPGEYRDLYWSFPIMVMLATDSLMRLSGVAQMPVFRVTSGQAAPRAL